MSIIENFRLYFIRNKKLIELNNQWEKLLNSGWNSGQGFNIGISANDIALLSGAYALAKENYNLGLPLPKIIAIDGSIITFNSFDEMKELLLNYGNARSILASSFATKRKSIQNASILEELIAIDTNLAIV
jgi:hypothetical protein